MCYKNGIIFLLSIISYALQSSGQDPCLEANFQELQNLPKRSPSYVMDSTPLCDRYITETWYRTKYHVMSSSPPTLSSCGTLYPVWLRGSTPPDGVTIDLTACEVGFSNDCERQYTVAVKNCTEFLVYKLRPLDACNSAYCFETGSECVNESLDGISVSFHNITWERYDNPNPNINLVRYEPFINLLCSFTPSDDDTLLYHIDWYVDNDVVIQGQTVDKTSLQDAILSAKDMINAGKKINSWIHCLVGAKAARDRRPCISQSSQLFFAGIEILNETVTLERMGNIEIMFRPTIPVASRTVEFMGSQIQSDFVIELSLPGNQQCTVNKQSISDCEKKIESFTYDERQKYDDPANWYKVYKTTVYNSDAQNYYLPDKNFVLRLKTSAANGNGAEIFSNVALHDIKINLVENEDAWKGKRCSSYADPHQTTFDGYQYECQEAGCITGKTYIFYRNEAFLQEVQVRHENCWGTPRCVCAVAVRAGKDVFTIDVCSGTQYINFPICRDNSLKVIKEYDQLYTVLLPTGTSVKIFLYNYGLWFINLEVYPTVLDVSRTSGLCGFLDGIITNDLRRANGIEDDIGSFNYWNNHPNEFSLSWQSTDAGDLLSMSQTVYDQLRSLTDLVNKHCLCDDKKISCGYKYPGCSTTNRGKEYFCVLHTTSRRKREIRAIWSSKKHADKVEGLTRIKRQTFSEVEAFTACNDAFQRSTYYDTCLRHIPNFSNETIVNCISDLTVTGDQNLTQLHLDTALAQCQQYILLNSTLQNENPNITTIIVNLCPNNCSNRGVCSAGNCTCEYGFGGSDCSFDVLSPPTITMISGDGICDKSEGVCDDITLYGYYFLENMGTTCYVTREQINGSNIVLSATSYSVKLEERTLFEGYCSLQYGPESSWTTKFTFNLSNDNNHFSENYSVYVYHSSCQTYHNDSGDINFTIQSGYCFINGSCVQSGTMKSNSSCWLCNPQFDVHDWTWDCNTTNAPDSSTSTSTLPGTTTAEVAHSSSSSPAVTTTESPLTQRQTRATEIAEETTSLNDVSISTNPTTESASSRPQTTSSTSATSSTSSEISSNGVSISTNPSSQSASSKPATSVSTSSTSSVTSGSLSTSSPSLSVSSTEVAGTLTTLKKSETNKSKTPNDQNEKLSSEVVGLIIAVTIVSFIIIVTAVIMIQKWIQGKKKEISSVNTNVEDDVCNFPDTTKCMSTKGNFNPDDLLHFESSFEKYSRPPSAASVRALPPTNDLSTLFDPKRIDKLFTVTK